MLKTWLVNNANISLQLDFKTIIFSSCSQTLIHFITYAAQYYVYKSKFGTKKLSIVWFEGYLKLKFANEQYIANVNNKMDSFEKKWNKLLTYMALI